LKLEKPYPRGRAFWYIFEEKKESMSERNHNAIIFEQDINEATLVRDNLALQGINVIDMARFYEDAAQVLSKLIGRQISLFIIGDGLNLNEADTNLFLERIRAEHPKAKIIGRRTSLEVKGADRNIKKSNNYWELSCLAYLLLDE
jgi:hypothetical protein